MFFIFTLIFISVLSSKYGDSIPDQKEERDVCTYLSLVLSVVFIIGFFFFPLLSLNNPFNSLVGTSIGKFGEVCQSGASQYTVSRLLNEFGQMGALLPFFLYGILFLVILNCILQFIVPRQWTTYFTGFLMFGVPLTAKLFVDNKDLNLVIKFDYGNGALLFVLLGVLVILTSLISIFSEAKKHYRFAIAWCSELFGIFLYFVSLTFVMLFSANSGNSFGLFVFGMICLFIISLGLVLYCAYRYFMSKIVNAKQSVVIVEESTEKQSFDERTEKEDQLVEARVDDVVAEPVKEHKQPEVPVASVESDEVKDSSRPRRFGWKMWTGVALSALAVCLLSFLFFANNEDKKEEIKLTYYTFSNVNLRSEPNVNDRSNVMELLPYGTAIHVISEEGKWKIVEVLGKRGYIASSVLLSADDFNLLDSVWGNEEAKEIAKLSHMRLALLDYYKRKQYEPDGTWKLFGLSKDVGFNNVAAVVRPYSVYPDFIFILKNTETNERKMVTYSFDNETKKPIFVEEHSAPLNCYIISASYNNGIYNVEYTNGY